MRYVSSRFKTEQNNDNRNYLKYADITLTDGTVLNLTNTDFWSNGMKFEDSVSDDSAFTIGSANINTVNLSINNFDEKYTDYDFTNAEELIRAECSSMIRPVKKEKCLLTVPASLCIRIIQMRITGKP